MITYDVVKWNWSWYIQETSPLIFQKKKNEDNGRDEPQLGVKLATVLKYV
jgi:hypothetical protein